MIARSRGISVELTNTSALEPGYAMNMFTVVGAISGNCEIGRVLIANVPVNKRTMDMTIASTGL